jgi:ABC-2 type transport system ATP-binding protein
LVADQSVDDFVAGTSERTVLVRTPSADEVARVLVANGASVHTDESGALIVSGMESLEVGKLAAADGLALEELTPQRVSLEEAFVDLTRDSVEYHTAEGTGR